MTDREALFTAQQIADLACGTAFSITRPDGTTEAVDASEVYIEPCEGLTDGTCRDVGKDAAPETLEREKDKLE
jgi:hypothetical protein